MGLHKAAEQGQVEPLKVAIAGKFDAYNDAWKRPDINGVNSKGDVALHLAVCSRRGELEAARVLLEKGASADARNGKGYTPLHVVASMCNDPDNFERLAGAAAKLLLKHGANANLTSTPDTLTPLHVAAQAGHDKLASLLLTKRADANALDSSGATPLHHAARALRAKVTLALIKAGADPQVADSAGNVARDAVAEGRDSFSKAIREYIDDAKQLRAEAIEEKRRSRAERAAAKAAQTKTEL